jgi:hypothetical protein
MVFVGWVERSEAQRSFAANVGLDISLGSVMGQKLSPPDLELYQRVDEVLHYIWDSIGVSGEPMARDEYYSYLPHVFSLLKSNENPAPIEKYLFEVATDRMGLKGNNSKDSQAAKILLDRKKTISEKYS